MIHLDVVDHQVVDLGGIDDGADAVQQVVLVRPLDRVEQGDLVVDDQKGVVGCPPVGRVPVEIPDIPVDGTDPVDPLCQLSCAHIAPYGDIFGFLTMAEDVFILIDGNDYYKVGQQVSAGCD